uniref:Ninjurin a n=1 Tax=Anopheles coluzzii TaxID=1518534 RepID=A0A6E8W6U4_ANOCL
MDQIVENPMEEAIEMVEKPDEPNVLTADAMDACASPTDAKITVCVQKGDIPMESLGTSDEHDSTSDHEDTTTSASPKRRHLPKGIVTSALDISLLTANANQLRLLLSYNEKSRTYFVCISLVIISLVMEIMQGMGVIIMKSYPKIVPKMGITISILVAVITVVNVLLAALLQV